MLFRSVAAAPTFIDGAEKNPDPASIILIDVTDFPEPTTALTDAGKFGDSEGKETVTFGIVKYPYPPLFTATDTRPCDLL